MFTLTCTHCGKKYQHKSCASKACSDECRKARKKSQDIRCKAGRGRIGGIETCPICGKEYEVVHTTQKYCTDKCGRRATTLAGKNKIKNVPRTCIICGADFMTSHSAMAKTCGPKCLGKYRGILEKERQAQLKVTGQGAKMEFSMPCPWQTGKLDTLPHGVASWSNPIMDPMSAGFPMRTFSVPSTASEVAA